MRLFILMTMLVLVSGIADATTFAHVTASGEILDPYPAASAYLYEKRFNAALAATWHVEQVPDGVQHDARYSGDMTQGAADFMDPSKYVNPDKTNGDGVGP